MMKHFIQTAFATIVFCYFAQAQKPIPVQINAAPSVYHLNTGETKTFTVTLLKNKAYEIWVEQKAIDILLTLKKGDSTLQSHDSTNGAFGPEVIHFVPRVTATYSLEVKPLADDLPPGKISLRVNELPTLDSNTFFKVTLSPASMKEDLQIFRVIRDAANSGLYRYRTRQQIDSIYGWAYSQVNKPMNIVDFYRIIIILSDFEGSCHNWTGLPYELKYYVNMSKGFFPYQLINIDGKIVVNSVNKPIPLGSRIISINGVADTLLMRRLFKYRPTDGYNITEKQKNISDPKLGLRWQVEFGTQDSFVVTYTKPGATKIETLSMKSISMNEDAQNHLRRHSLVFDSLFDGDIQKSYSFKQIDDSTALLNFRDFSMAYGEQDPAYKIYRNYLDSIFLRVKDEGKIKHLIIDVRNNGGGSDPNYEKAFSYIADASFKENSFAYINFQQVPFPQYFSWSSEDKENQQREQYNLEYGLKEMFPILKDGKYYQHQKYNPLWYPDNDRFNGKIYLLINDFVASAASHFASLVKSYSNATIIGEETVGGYYGHNGHQSVQYGLPNSKIKFEFSIVFVAQDAVVLPTQAAGHGIMPDYEVRQTFEDFMSNTDTEMNFVLQLIKHGETVPGN